MSLENDVKHHLFIKIFFFFYFQYIRMCERKLLNNNIMTLRLRFILLKIMRIFFQSKRIKNVGRSENY